MVLFRFRNYMPWIKDAGCKRDLFCGGRKVKRQSIDYDRVAELVQMICERGEF